MQSIYLIEDKNKDITGTLTDRITFKISCFIHRYIQLSMFESSPKKCVNCSQLKMILSCRLLGHLFDDLFMIVVVGKHIEHTAACAPFIMLIDQD